MSQQSLFTFDQHGGASVPAPPADITARKHGGNEQSAAAHDTVAPHLGEVQAEALAFLGSRGKAGGTAKEFAQASGRTFNEVSGRFSELKKLLLIVPTGEKRDGCAAYRVSKG